MRILIAKTFQIHKQNNQQRLKMTGNKKTIRIFLTFVLSLILFNPYPAAAEEKPKTPAKKAVSKNTKVTKKIDNKKQTLKKNEGKFFFGYINLMGTIVISQTDRSKNKALIEDMFTKKKLSYREGADLPYGIKLKKIEDNQIIMEKKGKLQALRVGAKSNYFREIKTLKKNGYRKIGSNEWIVNSHYLFKNSEELIKLAVDSGLAIKKFSKRPGLEITKDADTKMAGLGFKKGDKVIGINGVALSKLKDLNSAYKQMQNKENITIKIQRNGKPVDLNYWMTKRGSPRYNMKKILSSEKIRKMFSL